MLVMLPEGTKCVVCGQKIEYATKQGSTFTCEKCGFILSPVHEHCVPRPCPKCGGEMLDEWQRTEKDLGRRSLS